MLIIQFFKVNCTNSFKNAHLFIFRTSPLTLTGPKPFKCNKCSAEFAQIWELREHFDIIHAPLYGTNAQELGGVIQDKPMMMYQCADCNYWSLVIDELVAHHALVHPELEA